MPAIKPGWIIKTPIKRSPVHCYFCTLHGMCPYYLYRYQKVLKFAPMLEGLLHEVVCKEELKRTITHDFMYISVVLGFFWTTLYKLFPLAPSFCYPKWAYSSSHLNYFAQNKRIGNVNWVLIQLIPYFSIQIDLFTVLCIPINFEWYARSHFRNQGFSEGTLNTLTSLRSW